MVVVGRCAEQQRLECSKGKPESKYAWTARWMPGLPRGREENWTPTAETGEVACDLTLPVPLSQPCNGFITALHTALSYPQISRIFAGRRCLIDSQTLLGFHPPQHDAPTRWGCHRHSWWDDRYRSVHVHALCVCCRDSAHSGMCLSHSIREFGSSKPFSMYKPASVFDNHTSSCEYTPLTASKQSV